jgi:hypothetical protein
MRMGADVNVELGSASTTQISLGQATVRTLIGVASGAVRFPTDFYGKSAITITPTYKAIFGFGLVDPSYTNITNLVSSTGVVSTDTPGVGTARSSLSAATYGGDKAIFSYGEPSGGNVTNLVSNTGVVQANTALVGTLRNGLAAAGYGGDKAIFGYGLTPTTTPRSFVSLTNLISNTGVVASDTPGVGTARQQLAAATYGVGKAIFGYGRNSTAPGTGGVLSMTNLVSDTGVVASDTPGVGTARNALGAAGYGGDKAIFGYGQLGAVTPTKFSLTNLVSNTGVVASDTPGVGRTRGYLAAAGYSTTA